MNNQQFELGEMYRRRGHDWLSQIVWVVVDFPPRARTLRPPGEYVTLLNSKDGSTWTDFQEISRFEKL